MFDVICYTFDNTCGSVPLILPSFVYNIRGGKQVAIIIIFQQTNRCHKSRFSNGFVDNSINVSINISETHFCHSNSSRRIFWCACRLLVVAEKLNLMNSIKPLEQHQPRNPNMSNLWQKNNNGINTWYVLFFVWCSFCFFSHFFIHTVDGTK